VSARSSPLATRVPRELFERSLAHSLLGVARTWGGIVAAWWLAGASGQPLAVFAAVVLIGTLQYHLNVLGHDGLHFLLADSRRLNDALCRWLLHGPHGAPLASMRRNHLLHHTAFGAAPDLDRQYYDLSRFRRGGAFLRWLALTLAGGMTLAIVGKLLGVSRQTGSAAPQRAAGAADSRALDLASVLLSQAWIAVAAAWISGWWWAYVLLWLVPLFTVMMGLNAIRSCIEHADPPAAAPAMSSFESSALERFFVAPWHMNVHAEHHLVPAVPWHRLPALRRFLQREGLYGEVRLHPSYAARALGVARAIDGSQAA
jgi:fatty acid desaturase